MTDLSKTLQTTRDERVHMIDRGGGVHLALEYRRDIIAHSTSRIIVANNPALSGKVSIPPVRHDYQIHRQRNLGKESIEVQLDPTGGGIRPEIGAAGPDGGADGEDEGNGQIQGIVEGRPEGY